MVDRSMTIGLPASAPCGDCGLDHPDCGATPQPPVPELLEYLRECVAAAASAHAAGRLGRYVEALAEVEDTAQCLRDAQRAPQPETRSSDYVWSAGDER